MTLQRYGYVRCDGYHDADAWYDIIDHDDVVGRSMAHRISFDAACRITFALNHYADQVQAAVAALAAVKAKILQE